MGSDDYKTIGGGALKLKGAKVGKKKKKTAKSDLEKNLSTGNDAALVKRDDHGDDSRDKKKSPIDDDRHSNEDGEDKEEDGPVVLKTESERRYEEARKKRLLQIAQSSGSRPELLKTHKERVEELNTYLSRLSEHHDMPKIGPG
ncbi:uncharacterized protein Triagg1_1901 [Trichoderma aggressivum f. europaeum]|uniref:DUF1754-domain-containing protein n=1 Tax=Trichoderma aggressivum f. europaeum TaxID=173218 RepID=A0AAE1M2F1_9HYPO|nr:hypothetical protein Triagg1_1901 [Trichoderma aggressivum f. europaeum]